jgi:hypothetical protein
LPVTNTLAYRVVALLADYHARCDFPNEEIKSVIIPNLVPESDTLCKIDRFIVPTNIFYSNEMI